MAKTSEAPWPEHPLFPAEEGEAPKRIEFIQVIRHEEGRSKQIPRMFRAIELQSLEDIFNLWGGGVYELWGRQSSISNAEHPGKLTANRRYEIAGMPKPLSVDGSNAVAPAPAAVAPYGANGHAPDNSVMGMFMQMQMTMMQNAQENARQTAEAQRQAQERSRQETLQSQQMMMQMQTTMMTGMMGVVTAVVSSKGSGGVDDIAKMAGLLKDLGVVGVKGGGEEGETTESIGGIISNVADIVAGAVELKQGAQANGNGTLAPGSAAAALGLPSNQPRAGEA